MWYTDMTFDIWLICVATEDENGYYDIAVEAVYYVFIIKRWCQLVFNNKHFKSQIIKW